MITRRLRRMTCGMSRLTVEDMARAKTPRKPERGNFETLASGAIRVQVYAGIDPLTGRCGLPQRDRPSRSGRRKGRPRQTRTRLSTRSTRRNPRTKATSTSSWIATSNYWTSTSTRDGSYEGYIRNHIRPLLGKLPVGRLNGETLDSFYAILRTCRAHCGGQKYIEHRKSGPHKCTDKCRPHKCSPLSQSSIRQVH